MLITEEAFSEINNKLGARDTFAAQRLDGKWVGMNGEGRYKKYVQYDEVLPFHRGFAPARIGMKWGFVDGNYEQWRSALEPQFDRPYSFEESRTIVTDCGRFLQVTNGRIKVRGPVRTIYMSRRVRSFRRGTVKVIRPDANGIATSRTKRVASLSERWRRLVGLHGKDKGNRRGTRKR